MRTLPYRLLGRRIFLGALVVLWVGLSWLLILSRGSPESFLRMTFARHSQPDSFRDLNRITWCFWVVHSCLVLTAFSAIRLRRSDVLVVLSIGLVIGLVIGLLNQHWSDPDWGVFGGVCLMSWLASTLVGLSYWVVGPWRKPA